MCKANEKVYRICPMCGSLTSMVFTSEQMEQYDIYSQGIGYIQDIKADAKHREFLKTGYCEDCQEMLFGGND